MPVLLQISCRMAWSWCGSCVNSCVACATTLERSMLCTDELEPIAVDGTDVWISVSTRVAQVGVR